MRPLSITSVRLTYNHPFVETIALRSRTLAACRIEHTPKGTLLTVRGIYQSSRSDSNARSRHPKCRALDQLGYYSIMLVLIKEAKASRYTPFHRHPCSRIGHQPGFRPFQTQASAIGASRVRNLVFTKPTGNIFYENPKIHVLIRKSCCTFPF